MSEQFSRREVEGPEGSFPGSTDIDDLHTLNKLIVAYIGAGVNAPLAESEFNSRDKEEIFNGICAKWGANPDEVYPLLNGNLWRALEAALEFQDKSSDETELKKAALRHKTTVTQINEILDNYAFNEMRAAAEIASLQYEADVNYHEGAMNVAPGTIDEIVNSAHETSQISGERFDQLYGEAGKRIIQGENFERIAEERAS